MPEWPEVADPQSAWELMRVQEGPAWFEDRELWFVHAPDQLERIARDTTTFSSAVPGTRQLECDYLLTVDPPRHNEERATFHRHFGSPITATAAAASAIVSAIAQGVRDDAVVDLVSAFCEPLGAAVSDRIIGRLDEGAFSAAPKAIRLELRELLDRRSRLTAADAPAPVEDLLREVRDSGVAMETASGRVAGLACALLIAAEDTLPAGAALALARIAVGVDIDRTRPLGGDTPLLGLYRIAREAVTVGDAYIRAGDRVFLGWAAANQATGTNRYTYGFGPHRCPAARMVDQLISAVVLHAQCHWRLELAEPVAFRAHSHFRAPVALSCRLGSTAV